MCPNLCPYALCAAAATHLTQRLHARALKNHVMAKGSDLLGIVLSLHYQGIFPFHGLVLLGLFFQLPLECPLSPSHFSDDLRLQRPLSISPCVYGSRFPPSNLTHLPFTVGQLREISIKDRES